MGTPAGGERSEKSFALLGRPGPRLSAHATPRDATHATHATHATPRHATDDQQDSLGLAVDGLSGGFFGAPARQPVSALVLRVPCVPLDPEPLHIVLEGRRFQPRPQVDVLDRLLRPLNLAIG